jgi:hypothetical protein
MSASHLSVYGFRRALIAGIQRVTAQRDEIDRINVFPVADHDTGTNLAFTLGAVLQGLRLPRFTGAREVLRCVAVEASDGARGNAGAILSHFFQGAAEALPPDGPLTLAALARAALGGSARARTAVAEPREGTILSVMKVFAEEMQAQAEAGGSDNRAGFLRALERTREALRQTQYQIKALRSAGVVDAGARGFVELLEGMADFIERGRGVVRDEWPRELAAAGVDSFAGCAGGGGRRHFAQCVVNASAVDRTALKAALRALPLAQAVMAGSRDRVRLYAHLDDPAPFFATAARFGVVSRAETEDTLASSPAAAARRRQVAIVTDSGADLPAEAVERLNLHLVPQRVSVGGRDFVDGVTISAGEFYEAMRNGPVLPRTSQPPPGDFRRMFEFLLSQHGRVIDVSLTRSLSGTLQSAASAAARTDPERVTVFDSHQVAAGQGLLAIWAAEAAQAGLGVTRILEGLAQMRERTTVFAVVRDIRYAVRGGRVPRAALPLTRLLRVSLLLRSRPGGRLGLMGGLWGRDHLPERFARKIARQLDPARRYRLMVGHCDCAGDAERMKGALLASGRGIDRLWLVETGVAIGAHAGPGSLVLGVQDYEPPSP